MIADQQASADRVERALAAVAELLAERGIGRHGIFFDADEGEAFPDGTESMSGKVIDPDGRVFSFWTEWDAERGRPRFWIWREITPPDDWMDSKEYRAARAAAGLD